MSITKVTFTNKEGHKLTARLEMPFDSKPRAYALFAHCFTCNKNFSAVKNIVKGLNSRGIAVLKFDFTGLGESDGDFSDTNFSSNIDDICAAGDWLEKNHKAPQLLVGHSLGGAAVIFAAGRMESVEAVATIGAPSDPKHVSHLFKGGLDELKAAGSAEVNIGGRPFLIKEQFLTDIGNYDMKKYLPSLRKALLIAHSPQDTIVEINNAGSLYQLAHHPKSFVSLDGADHLLSNSLDSKYIGEVIATWSQRYLNMPKQDELKQVSHVIGRIQEGPFLTEMRAGRHHLIADEPESYGGSDLGPTPYEFVSSGLASCTAMTMKMYAGRKKWPLDEVTVEVDYSKEHGKDCDDCESSTAKLDTFKRTIRIKGDLDDAQKKRLMEIADKCPVHKTLSSDIQIHTSLEE